MTDDNLTPDDVRRMAAQIGMTSLADQHVQQLLRASIGARARRAALPIDPLAPGDEPAHVFHVTPDDER